MERIGVTFATDGAETGDLTWGQRQVWTAMREVGTSMSIGGVVPVGDGREAGDFAQELRFFLMRYPAMRTLLRIAPDGTTTQEVHGTGEAGLEVHTAEPAEGAQALADEIFAGWRARNFDYTREWPIRMAVVRAGDGGPVSHVVVMVCHIATDAGGLGVMIRELAERATAGERGAAGHLDLVARQRSAGRQSDNAMRYWETQLRAIEPQRFARFAEPDGDRFRQLVWRSPALYLAGERLAALLGVDAAPVMLAAYAVAFGRVAGGDGPFAAQVIISNRFRPGLADLVSPLAQNGLVVFDAKGVSAAEAVARARQASMSASKYAYYDPGARLALFDRVAKERGEPIDLAVFHNERRVALSAPAEPPAEDAIRAALPRTELVRETVLPYFNEKLMINIDDLPDTVQITTEADTAYLPLPDVRRLLSEMESFVVAAALDPSTHTF
ncbi:condensation domain-containing protein [Dactylosporangium sp. NPDC051485]|uniref:condensation domain-containing protein n=1 Tax=Dactylosporangium sp. NPDC051485 TaxID=3154846 RepID=UPI00343138D3